MSRDNYIQLTFFDSINPKSASDFIHTLKLKTELNPKANIICLDISSPGGQIDVAIELYNFLRNIECELITNNISVVNSAAIILYLAGTKRICNPLSSFYFHSVTKKLRGNFDSERLLREAKELQTNTNRITKILADNTFKNVCYWKHLMKKGEIITALRSFKLGISTAISDHNLPNEGQID